MYLRGSRGFTLVQMMIAVLLLGIALSGSIAGARLLVGQSAMRAVATEMRAQLVYARAIAISRRENIELTLEPGGHLRLADSKDSVIRRIRLIGDHGSRLDSVLLRPKTLRFNPRGQAAAGSVYLFGSGGGVRLVVNFLGRVREERLP